jgi:hypothetical protein
MVYSALSYFEVEDFKGFLEIRRSLLAHLLQAPRHITKNPINEMLIDFAYAMIKPERSMEVFEFWDSNESLSEMVKRRRLLFLFLTKQNGLLRKYRADYKTALQIEYQQEKFTHKEGHENVIQVIDDFLSGKDISSLQLKSVVSSYASIGWGKKQYKLSKKIAERHWQL